MLNYAQYLIILMKYICLKLWLLQLAWSSIQLSDCNIRRNKTKENITIYSQGSLGPIGQVCMMAKNVSLLGPTIKLDATHLFVMLLSRLVVMIEVLP